MLLPFYPAAERTRQPLILEPAALPPAQKGVAYDAALGVSQNETPVVDFYITEGALPDGLVIEHVEAEDTAKITGIPTESGTFTFTILVQCYGTSVSGQQASREYVIIVGE
jgi:hypothetical protein